MESSKLGRGLKNPILNLKSSLLCGAEEWTLLPSVTQEHLCDNEPSSHSTEPPPFSVWVHHKYRRGLK